LLWVRIFIWTLCIIMKNQFIEENLEILETKILVLLDEVETMNQKYRVPHGESIEDQVEEIQEILHSIREIYEAEPA